MCVCSLDQLNEAINNKKDKSQEIAPLQSDSCVHRKKVHWAWLSKRGEQKKTATIISQDQRTRSNYMPNAVIHVTTTTLHAAQETMRE